MSIEAMSWAWKNLSRAPEYTRLTLMAIADHADPDGECYPSRRRLCEMTGVSRATMTRHLSALEGAGMLVRTPRHRENGSRTSTLYRIPIPPGLTGEPPPRLTRETPPVSPVSPPEPSVEPIEDLGVHRVFEHWKSKMGKRADTRLSADRKRKVEARLREGYSVPQLLKAVDGCASEPFYMGENDRGKAFNDLTLICKSGSKVEEFIESAEANGDGSGWDRMIA